MLINANIVRIINSEDVQSVVKKIEKNKVIHDKQKKNLLLIKSKLTSLNHIKRN